MQKSAYSVSALFTHHLYSTLSCSATVQQVLKRQLIQKLKVLWPFAQPRPIQNLYVFHNTKGDILKNVHNALFHIMKLDVNQS